MSLGLGDLKKATRAKAAAKTKSQTAKPWDASGLAPAAKPAKSRKKVETDDLFMNIEWATSPSIHFADFETLKEEKIAQLQEVVKTVEAKIKRATSGPLKVLNYVLNRTQNQK
jgi:hypothetical protein